MLLLAGRVPGMFVFAINGKEISLLVEKEEGQDGKDNEAYLDIAFGFLLGCHG